jgi:hypothetical protein
MAKIYVIRVDYELANKPDIKWIANVAAYSEDEAVNYLRKNLGNIKITTIERKTRLDAISNEVENTIIKSYESSKPANVDTQDEAEEKSKKEKKTPEKKKINFKKDKK